MDKVAEVAGGADSVRRVVSEAVMAVVGRAVILVAGQERKKDSQLQ